MTAQIHLPVALRSAAEGQQQVLGLRQGAFEAGCLHDGDTQDILRLTGEGNVVQLLIGQGFPGEDALVNEGFQIGRLHTQALEGAEGGILLLTDDAQEKMVRANSVAARAHGLFTCVFDDEVQVLGDL